MKIAAILIVKSVDEEANHLQNCLESIKGHVDGIFLNLNHKPPQKPSEKVRAVAEQYTNNIIETKWHDNFAEARNANLAQVPEDYDWIIWLDVDDTIDHPEKIREVAKESSAYDCVYVDYEYDHDEHGNVTTLHMVGRLFKNNGSHHWNPKTKIHETLIETRASIQGMTQDFKVIHHAPEERTRQSFERNIKMLESQLKEEAKDPDPRTFFYLGSAYMDAGDNESALELLSDYLTMSGWDQERSLALVKMGRIYLEKGDTTEAKNCFARSVAEDPDNPEPRIELGSLEIELEQYKKAVSWLEYVLKMEKNQTTLEINPLNYTFRTYFLLAEAYLNMGGKFLDKAEKYARKAMRYKKKDAKVVEYCEVIISVNKDRKELETLMREFKKLKKKKDKLEFLDKIPDHLADNPVVSRLRQSLAPFKWPKDSIAIMTGDTAIDEWGPWSLKDGIGGSEEAIIRIAPKLAKLGYKVVVFGKPGPRTGIYEGVQWRNYWDCNLEDKFDIFVAWRAPFIFERKIKSRKSYLWLHDVMEVGEFTPNRLANLAKVMVLSKYHRSLFPNIPDDKILLSANGIDPDEFNLDVERDPHKIFYGSSHVRGLAYLYKVWPEVKKAVPEATLDVYYGRESYDKVHRGNPERIKWMDDMVQTAKELDGVTDHGKIGQDEIVRKMFASGIWAYPCLWPEIYCITAIKAQASGCIPVSTDFAALDETIQFGSKIHGEPLPNGGGDYSKKFLKEYTDLLIWWLTHPEEQEKERAEMMEWAKTNSWARVASDWNREFNE